MPTIPLKLYAAPASVSVVSNAANLIIPRSGNIIGCIAQIMGVTPSGDGPLKMQVSLLSVEQFTQNDAQGLVVEIWAYWAWDTSSAGTTLNHIESTLSGVRIPVVAGQKIYVHTDALTTSDTFLASVYLEI